MKFKRTKLSRLMDANANVNTEEPTEGKLAKNDRQLLPWKLAACDVHAWNSYVSPSAITT